MQTKNLGGEVEIPVLGFGTWQIVGAECERAVTHALSVGYRHIDTADAYGNHEQVGNAIAQSAVAREDIFLTTKVFRNTLPYQDVHDAVKRFLRELQTDYIDLLLIHWPNKAVPMSETLKAMSELKDAGTVRALGVSNFTKHHLEDALATGVPIVVNQVEAHPYFNQADLRAFCKEHNIAVTAYSPLGRGEVLKDAVINELAKKYDATPAQLILSWVLARDMIAIPKSTNPERIAENFAAQNIHLDETDLEQIDNLPQKNRILSPAFNEFD